MFLSREQTFWNYNWNHQFHLFSWSEKRLVILGICIIMLFDIRWIDEGISAFYVQSTHTHKKRSLDFQFPFSSNLKIQTSFLGCRSSSIKRSDEFIKRYQSYASKCTKPVFIPGNNILNSNMESMIFIFFTNWKEGSLPWYILLHAAKYQMNLSSHLRIVCSDALNRC